jgi:hypothetical protein
MVEKKVCPRDFERNQQSSAKISADERYLIAAFGFIQRITTVQRTSVRCFSAERCLFLKFEDALIKCLAEP